MIYSNGSAIFARITRDVTKYQHAHSLDTNILAELSELVTNPSQNGKYEALKTHLLSKFQDSEEKRLRTLFNQAKWDQRPSCFPRYMKDLTEGKISDKLFKSLWMQRLPIIMQTAFATCRGSLDNLATTVDRIHDIMPSVSSLKETLATASTPSLENQISELLKKFDRLVPKRRRSNSHRAVIYVQDQFHQVLDTAGITNFRSRS